MLLVLMRHGIAEEGTPDEARELTSEGCEKTAWVASLLCRFGVRPDLILTSQRVRAQQTAQVVIDTLGLKIKWVSCDALDFFSPWEDFLAEVNRQIRERRAETVLIAGHMPQVSILATMCLIGEEAEFHFRKSAAMALRFDDLVAPGHGDLHFYLTPGMAKAI